MSVRKQYYKVVEEEWAKTKPILMAEILPLINRVYDNNRYLLKAHGITKERQRKELREKGIIVTYQSEWNQRRGIHIASLQYLNNFAHYWGMSIIEMMSKDLSAEETLKNTG